jgi:hypothetical protein
VGKRITSTPFNFEGDFTIHALPRRLEWDPVVKQHENIISPVQMYRVRITGIVNTFLFLIFLY